MRFGSVMGRTAYAAHFMALGVIGVGIGSCASPTPSSAAQVEAHAEELDILETLFRYQLEHNESGRSPLTYDYVFLSRGIPGGAEQRDVSPEILARFDQHSPPI